MKQDTPEMDLVNYSSVDEEAIQALLWENIVEGEYYSLEAWRGTDAYRDL